MADVTVVSNANGQPGYWATSVGTLSLATPLPDGSTSVLQGSTLNITWVAQGTKLLTGAVSVNVYPQSSPSTLLATVSTSLPATQATALWQVPSFMPLGVMLVVVTSTLDSSCTITAAFTVGAATPAAGFSVDAPAVGAVWALGSTVSIAWSSFGAVSSGTVTLALAYGSIVKANITSVPIAASLGTLTWTVPAGLPALANYYSVLITSVQTRNVTASSAPVALIVAPASGLVVVLPQNGTTLYRGKPLNASYLGFGAEAAGAVNLAIAPLGGGGATTFYAGGPGASGNASYANTTWLSAGAWYSVCACSVQTLACGCSQVLVAAGPTYGLVLTSPVVDTTWYKGSPVAITWQAFYPLLLAGGVQIELLSTTSLVSVGTVALGAPAAGGSAVWTVPTTFASGTYYLRLTSTVDTSSVFQSSNVITVLGGALQVTSPVPGSLFSWDTSSQFNITFVAWGSQVANGNVAVELWYLGCCLRSTLVTGFPAAGGVWTWPTPYSSTQSSTPHAS